MKIAILGAGNVGRALASSAVKAGHTVTITASDPDHASEAAALTGARAAESNLAAVNGADAVVFAFGYSSLDGVLTALGTSLDGKTIIDPINALAPDLQGLAVETSVAELIQSRVPGAHVVKAFNTAFAARTASPVVDGMAVDGFVAGDSQTAKQAVLELVKSIGFRPVDVGSLKMARGLEWLALLNIALQIRTGGSWQAGWKLVEPTLVTA